MLQCHLWGSAITTNCKRFGLILKIMVIMSIHSHKLPINWHLNAFKKCTEVELGRFFSEPFTKAAVVNPL